MSILSAEQKAALRGTTAGAARALVEDLEHIREVLDRRQTSPGEIRRLSAIMRRLVVENDLGAISAPRFGKLTISVPDRKEYYEMEKRAEIHYFASAGAKVFGYTTDALIYVIARKVNLNEHAKVAAEIAPKENDKIAAMRIDNFAAQKVLCYEGKWVSRRAAIKFIANFGSGVHSKAPESEEEKLISNIRAACVYKIVDGQLQMHVMPERGDNSALFTFKEHPDEPLPADFPESALDPVLMEVLAAAHFIARSPDVIELEQIIRTELGMAA